ncbi:MAG: hypothetical protein J2P57_16000 [Acidimicrobiaceae bacterium]|nr:hypothetical protein [Acidimicrobiaceae bacterium]
MLFVHEVHTVVGRKEDEFEAAFRDYWMPTMAKTDYARLLWYTNHAHGSGLSYNVVTVTAVRDGRAWEDIARRVQRGDLQPWMRELDTLRHDVVGKVLVPLYWSPVQEIDLDAIPADGRRHDLTLYMEDTMWPYAGKLQDYIDASGSVYAKSLGAGRSEPFITIELALQAAFATHVRGEVMLMQKIHDLDRLQWLLTSDMPPEIRGPGTWMHEALAVRDQWESKLLRTSAWSPLY